MNARKNDGSSTASPVPDDGAIQAGAPLAFVDNRDGTISDLNTGLMWEKKDRSAGMHDVSLTLYWDKAGNQTIWKWLDSLNSEVNPIFNTVGFAGYSDWRIPNINEMRSIIDFGLEDGLFRHSVFWVDCNAGCSVATCSCSLQSDGTWTSTTAPRVESLALVPLGGQVNKDLILRGVRAVRGGVPRRRSTFSEVQAIFTDKCSVPFCHSGDFPANDMSLEVGEAFDAIVGVEPFNLHAAGMGLLRVDPGDANNSYIFIKVAGTPPIQLGSQMPLFANPLSEAEVATIRDWIDAGANP